MRFLLASLLLTVLQGLPLAAQNTPWDLVYCINGGENKTAGIARLPGPNPVEKPGWNLVFSDEFTGDSLDTVSWSPGSPYDDKPDTCLRGFSIWPENVTAGNGTAVLTNTAVSTNPGCPYSYGEIKTMSVKDSSFASYYFYGPGFVEARVKLFSETGQGAACWLWGIGTPADPGGNGPWTEIDLFELDGQNANLATATYHWTNDSGHVSQTHRIYLTESSQPYDLTAGWTIFGLEWDTSLIRWYVNNQVVKELDLSRVPPFCIGGSRYSKPVAPFTLRLNTGNNAVGNQSSAPDPAAFPREMLVDYVRVYRRADVKAAPILLPSGNRITQGEDQLAGTGLPALTYYYPGVKYAWSSAFFETLPMADPIPRPPGRRLIMVNPGTPAGFAYPLTLQTEFPGGRRETDTAWIEVIWPQGTGPGRVAAEEPLFDLLPNPATGMVTFQYNGTPRQALQGLHYRVCDQTGQTVRIIQATGTRLETDITGLRPGVYVVTCITGNEPAGKRPLIILRP